MGSVNTIIQAPNKTRVAKAEYRQAVANTRNTNVLESNKSNLANFMRSFSNHQRAKAASKEYNHQMDVLSEELRAGKGAGFNAQLQLAQARGALAAQAGAVGVGGSSADLMDSMIRLQMEMDVEARENAQQLLASRGGKQTAQIMSNAYSQMDLTQTFGQYDFRTYIEPKAMKRRFGKLVGVAVATYFGGPQAGEAVADMAVGEWQAQNGNFDGASESFGRGMSNALGAYQDWNKRGGQPWGEAVAEGWGSGRGKQTGNVTITDNSRKNVNYDTQTTKLGWW